MNTINEKIAILENKISYYEGFMEKLDSAIDKMSDASVHISKMLAVHEEKLNQSNKTDQMIISLIESNKVDSSEKTKLINDKIDKVENEISELKKMKWLVRGIGIATTISIATLIGIFQLFLTSPNNSFNIDHNLFHESK